MDTQKVLLGELVIDNEPPIELRADLPSGEVRKRTAALKDRLAYLLDTRFRPADPEPPRILTVEDVADLLHCRCRTVLRMIRRGDLHPRNGEDGELYFDRAEVERVQYLPLGGKLTRLITRM